MPPFTITIDFKDLHDKLGALQDVLITKGEKDRANKLTPTLELLEDLVRELPRNQPKPEGMTQEQRKSQEINDVLKLTGEFLTMAIPKDCPYTLVLSPQYSPNVLLYLHSGDEVELVRRMKEFIGNYEKTQ